jgi:hypothetical protein
MHTLALALYGGPDQIMTVTSGLASLAGLLLIFWNKVLVTFSRVMRFLRPSGAELAP